MFYQVDIRVQICCIICKAFAFCRERSDYSDALSCALTEFCEVHAVFHQFMRAWWRILSNSPLQHHCEVNNGDNAREWLHRTSRQTYKPPEVLADCVKVFDVLYRPYNSGLKWQSRRFVVRRQQNLNSRSVCGHSIASLCTITKGLRSGNVGHLGYNVSF